jgi:O-antigen ligase
MDTPPVNVGLVAYATGCTLFVGLVLLTNWPTYAYQIRGGMLPLYFYVVPGILMIPIVFAHPQVSLRMLREPVFWWFTAFVLLGLAWQILEQDFSEEANQQWRLRALVFILFTTIAILASESRRPVVALLIVGCVLLSGAFSWFDALRPFRFVPRAYEFASEGRGAGLFINPNVAASFVVVGTIVALPWVPMRLRAAMLIAMVMCVAPTFSRAGFLLAAVVILGAVFLGLVKRLHAVLVLVSIPVLFVGVNIAYDYLMTHSEDRKMQSVVQRLTVLGDAAQEDESIELRADAAARAWALFKQEPLIGAGLGKTTSAAFVTGPHNMYVMLMAEQGLVGLALYLSLILLLLRRGWQLMMSAPTIEGSEIGKAIMIFALYIGANGLFSHNVLDEAQAMFLLAFLVVAGLRTRAMRSVGSPLGLRHSHMPVRRVVRAGRK